MKQLLGLITATTILVPTAVSAQTIESMSMTSHSNVSALINGQGTYRVQTLCSLYASVEEIPVTYFCSRMLIEVTSSQYLSRDQMLMIAEEYFNHGGEVTEHYTNGGSADWVVKPEVGQLY